MSQYPSLRNRYVWLTDTDWRGFADLLAETFPSLRYYASLGWNRSNASQRPEVKLHRHLMDVERFEQQHIVDAVFDESWHPDVQQLEDWTQPGTYEWSIVNNRDKYPSIMFQFDHLYTSEQFATMTSMQHCCITFYAGPDSHEDKLLSQKFFRLLGKFATNRNQVQFELPGRRVIHRQEKGSLFWPGRDAIRWAREDPERVFLYNAQDWGFRPAD